MSGHHTSGHYTGGHHTGGHYSGGHHGGGQYTGGYAGGDCAPRGRGGTGEQFRSALTEALQSGDFKNLNDLVSQTVTDTLNEWKSPDARFRNQKPEGEGRPAAPARRMPLWQQRAIARVRKKQELARQEAQREAQERSLPAIQVMAVGSVSNVLYQTFGGIGLGVTGLVTFIHLLSSLSGDGSSLASWIVNLLFLGGFFGMIRLGISQKRRLKRAQRYLQLCDHRAYGEIARLAAGTGRSEGYVVRDLQRMLAAGIFPEGHLDRQKTCFMLNDAVYKQYLTTEEKRLLKETEERKTLENRQATQPEPTKEQASELQTMVAEGAEYIRRLRDLNDKIPGEAVSEQLYCLENLLRDIFDGVRTHPEQMPRMHKLMDYYLPTTLKLVESYEAFDRVGSPGADIVKAKAEIENTLSAINAAFRELLNNLFQDAVFDATTDAQVLKSMLAREGLMREMSFPSQEKK